MVVGVPKIMPVVLSIDKPAGKVGLMLYMSELVLLVALALKV